MINRSNLFRRAHALAHQIVSSCSSYHAALGLALARVWKAMKEEMKKALAEALELLPGTKVKSAEALQDLKAYGKVWVGGKHKRLYLNAKALGLKCDYYHSGNVSRAWVNGEDISNCEARRILGAGAYIDLVSGEVIDDRRHTFRDNFGDKINALIARNFN